MGFGEKLQELRKMAGLSQEQLAEKCGISRQSVSKWELGQGYPETQKLLMLCRALSVDLDYLLRDEIENRAVPNQSIAGNPYLGFLGQWVTLSLYEKDISAIKLAAIKAMNDDYIVFERGGKIGIMGISNIKTISKAMISEKKAEKLPAISTFELNNTDNPYGLIKGKPCTIKLKQGNNTIFSNAAAFIGAKIVGITDENLRILFRGKGLIVKLDDILLTVVN